MTATAHPAPAREALPNAACPYRGLVPFSEEDAAYFFGRGAEREIIAANLIASRLTLLYAPSGVGKSSVLLAGVLHDLREMARDSVAAGRGPEYVPVVVRDWRHDPLATLNAAIADGVREVVGDVSPVSGGDLAEGLAAWAERADATLLLILDQFEEFLLYHGDRWGDDDPAPQLAQALSDDDLPVNALISLREDALAGLDRFKGRVPHLFDNYLRLRHLDATAGRQAIDGPVTQWNAQHGPAQKMEVDDDLAEAVLAQVGAGQLPLAGGSGRGRADGAPDAGIEAPFLQLVLTRVWEAERAAPSARMRLATLEGLGGADRIVGTYLDEQMERLSAEERDVASAVFHQLVTPSGAKVARSLADLAEYTEVPRDQLRGVLEKLSQGDDWRIVRGEADPKGELSFEIFHDVLAEPVLDWRARHEQARAARDAVLHEQDAARRRRRRLFRAVGLGGLGIVALVATVLTLVALGERDDADRAREHSFTLELAASSLAQRDSDPELAVMLALRAAGRERTPETVGALRAAVAADPLRRQFPSHDGGVRDLAVTRDGTTIAASYDKGTARLWRIADRRPGPVLRAGTKPVLGARFTSDGRLVATAGGDGIAVWDARTGHLLHRLLAGRRAAYPRWEPGGRRLLAVVDRRALMYDAGSGRRLRTLPEKGVLRVQWGLGGRPVTGGLHGATLWDVSGRRRERRLRGPIMRLITSFNGERAVVITLSRRFVIWDLRSGRTHTALRRKALDATIDANGRRAVSAARGGTAQVWDARTGRRRVVLQARGVTDVRMSPDGATVATLAATRSAAIWDARTGGQLGQLGSRLVYAPSLLLTPSSDVVSGGLDGAVRLWRVAGGTALARFPEYDGAFGTAFSADGRRFVTSSGRVWDMRTGRKIRELPFYGTNVALSAHGDEVAMTSDCTEPATLWSVATGKRAARLTGAGKACSVRYSPDGTRLVTAGEDGAVGIWDARDHTLLRTLGTPAPKGRQNVALDDAAYTSDGAQVVAGGRRGILHVFDAHSGRQVRSFRVPVPTSSLAPGLGWINGVATQPHGDLVAVASDDGFAHVWDLRTGLRRDLPTDDGVAYVQFTPNGQLLATASYDGTARLWDAGTGRQLSVLGAGQDAMESAVISPDGRRIALAADYQPVRIVACALCGSVDELMRTARSLVTRRFTRGEVATLLHGRG